ncbi:MAG: efflux RND transporter permease subunit, partial [Acidimicrobiales bacterium]
MAALDMVSARSLIDHEDGLRRQVVVANPRTTDQSGYARGAREAIAARVRLPSDVYLRYGGTAPAQAAAARELLLHSAAA